MKLRDVAGLWMLGAGALLLISIGIVTSYGQYWFTAPSDRTVDTAEALDLAAQQQMAIAAWVMAGATVFGLGITGATLWLLRSTLHETYRTANATETSDRTNRQIGEAQVRAYMSVIGAKATEGIFSTVTLEVKNSGQSPAQRVFVEGQLSFSVSSIPSPPDENGVTARPNEPAPPDHSSTFSHFVSDLSAQTQVPYNLQTVFMLSTEQRMFTDRRGNSDLIQISLSGTVSYNDVFGSEHVLPFDFRGFAFGKLDEEKPTVLWAGPPIGD